VQKLTVQHVESFYALLAKEGSSARSIKVVHAVLHRALAHAVYLNLVSRNVCDIAKKSLPQHTRYEIQTLTKEQAQRLLEEVRGQEQFEALLTLAITTGMRRGELVALRWSDIHFEESYLQVRRSARRAGRTGYGLQITEPKTASGRRNIVLSAFLIEVLKRHQDSQEERRQEAADAWRANDLVFCGQHGEYLNPNRPSLWLKRLLKDAGLGPMRFHDLRHSAATLLLSMGVHVKVVQELPGHSTIAMTLNVYAHVLPSLQQDAMDKLSDLFEYDHGGDESQRPNA
jgi:integrase